MEEDKMQYHYEKVSGGKRITAIVVKPNAMSNNFTAIKGVVRKFARMVIK
jgi:hypothetical protein